MTNDVRSGSGRSIRHPDVLVVDWHGGLRGNRLPASMRGKAIKGEIRMPLSTRTLDIRGHDRDEITGLGLSRGDPDSICIPDPSGFHAQPWNPSHQQIMCTLLDEDGSHVFDADQAAGIEHRVAGADANPYLVLTAVISGNVSGLDEQVLPAEPPLLAGNTPFGKPLTHDWLTAIECFSSSNWMCSVLGKRFCDVCARIKRHETHTFNRQVSDVDLQTYLSRV